ncbi:MAG: MFS transporter [Chloroflexota bacterium]|nr:MFS transporter [Chloroflexota bacterium]
MTETTGQRAGRREWLGLAVLMLPTLLIAMDFTVLHLAVPHLTADLAPSSAQLLWIVDIYGFLIAGSLITMGTLGDRIGRRRLLLVGAAAFGLASILAAFSPSAEALIAARALLGVAGATLMPSTMSLLRTMFPDPQQFTVAIGVWVSGFSAGSALGPLLGGWMLEHFWWGSVFLLNVPVMVALLVLGPILLPEYRNPEPGRFDLLSAGQSLATVLLVIFGVKRLAEAGLGWVPLLSIAAGAVVGVLFLRRQRTLPDPLLDLGLFANRAFSTSVGTMTLGIFAFLGANFFIAQYLQLVLGLSLLEAGLWTLPGAIAFIVSSNLAPRLVRWLRPVVVVTIGWALAAVGFAILARVGADGLPVLVAANVILPLGFGLVVTLVVEMILGAAPPERAGAASALSETSQELGGALGIAVLGSIGTAVYRSEVTEALPAGLSPEAAEGARDTLGGAVAAAAGLPDPLGGALLAVTRDAFVQGLQLTAVISAAVLAGIAVLVLAVLRQPPAGGEPEAPVPTPSEPVFDAACAD